MSAMSIAAVFASLFIMSRALSILRDEGSMHAVLASTARGVGVVSIMVTILGLIALTAEARVLP
jgi:amino acid permease